MPWKETSVMEQRIEFIVRAISNETTFSSLCSEYGISRPTGYRWIKRYQETGSLSGLAERTRRPLESPFKTDLCIEERIVHLRKRYGWGARKLQVLLDREGIRMCVTTINRIIKRNGLIEPEDSCRQAKVRYERENPNELWQMDFKGEWPIKEGKCYPLSIIDDSTRYVVGLHALTNQRSHSVQSSMISTFKEYGVPDAVLMDHGTPWWSNTNSYGLTSFAVFLIKQGIELIYSGVGHPQTQGKVERFHRTLKRSIGRTGRPKTIDACRERFMEFVEEYNYIRPHEALGMDVPSKRYKRSSNEFNPQPSEYDYPSGSLVLPLNQQGMLKYNSRRYFVCESLAHERVQVIDMDDKLLVKYRHMYVREIEKNSGRTTAVVLPERLARL